MTNSGNEPPYGQQPDPSQPAYGQPVYGQPPYGQPVQPPYGQPAYGQPQHGYPVDPMAPYGRDPMTGEALSDKSKLVAGLLQLLLPFAGICGVGRLYAGDLTIGLIQLLGMFVGYVLILVLVGLLIVPAIWLWTVIDGIILLSGSPRDRHGRLLRA